MSEEILNLRKLNIECKSDKYLNIGRKLIETDIGKAFSFLSLGLSIDVSKKEAYAKEYFSVLERWSSELLEKSRYQDSLKLFDVAQEIFPNNPDFKYLLAGVLFRLGKTREAWEYSLKVSRSHGHDPKVQGLVAALTSILVDRWHFPMINDNTRNNLFRLAIKKCISEGHTSILDIGCGSGLLSIFACREGGRVVYACEVDEFMYELAGNILKLNNAEVRLLNCSSTDIGAQIPSKVSLVISETFDAGLFGENILTTLNHAWDELLLPPKCPSDLSNVTKPETYGKVIPSSAELYLAIIQCDTIQRQTKANLKLGNDRFINVELALKEPYLSEKVEFIPGKYTLLSSWTNVLNVNFNSPSEIKDILNGGVNKDIKFVVVKEGRIDGVILAFKLHLDVEQCIETFPGSNMCWENAIFPCDLNNICKVGDEITFRMLYEDVLKLQIVKPKENNEPLEVEKSINNSTSKLSFKTADMQLLKCINSKSFTTFFQMEAQELSGRLENIPLSILDTCDYPAGGMEFLTLNSSSKLYISNENAFELLTKVEKNIYPSSAVQQKVDVVIFWPFTKEGTLIENFTEELTRYRNLLSDGGRIIPDFLEIQMIGLESSRIASMTRINDINTCGVKIGEIFNLVKTQHHLDMTLEEISYKPMTPLLTPVRYSLNDPSSFMDILENNSESTDFLSVGSRPRTKTIRCTSPSTGNIIGFGYWFEMSGIFAHKPNINSVKHVAEESLLGADGYEVLSPQSCVEEESTLSTFTADSPINQCILLLDEFRLVTENEELDINFSISDGFFSVFIS